MKLQITKAELEEILKDAIANCYMELGLGNEPIYWERKKERYEQLLKELLQ
jgi:hypothetical protein